MSKTAVVILNWNGTALLKQFVPQLIKHTNQPDVSLIVADNGSTDESLQTLKLFPEIEVIDLEENHGFAKGYNIALEQVDAEYLLLLNSDVEVTENWLQPMVDFMDAKRDFAACQPKIKDFNKKTAFEYAGAAGGELDILGYPFCRGRVVDDVEEDNNQYNAETEEIFWASGACMLVRKKVFDALGGLDSDFWAHMEEIDFCWRAINSGYKIGIVTESEVYHVGGGSLAYGSPRKLYQNFRNNLFLLYKNLPSKKIFPILFLRMMLDGVAGLSIFLSGEWHGISVVIKAHADFYKAIPALRKKRNANQFNHRLGFAKLFPKVLLWRYYFHKERTFSALRQYKMN